MVWAKRISRTVSPIKGNRDFYEVNDYSLGYNSFIGNDKFALNNGKSNMLRLAKNARIITLGEYSTRKGFDKCSDVAGETKDQEITSTTGASDKAFSDVTRLAQKFTCGTSGRLTKVELNLKNDASSLGIVMVEVWTDATGPATMLARSSIANTSIAATYGYLTARFVKAPELTATTSYWIVAYSLGGSGSYSWSGNTSATTAMTSTDSGSTWATTAYCLNFKEYYAPTGGVIGQFRAYKSNGTKVSLMVQGTTLYSVNEVTGALTAIKSGLSASATNYRFVLVNDIVYYINGYDGLRKWDFTTESQVSATNYTHIVVHQGLLMLVPSADPTAVVYSNFGEYEVFTSTDLIYAPAAKTGDPITSLVSLNGYLIVTTLDNKYILSGTDNATFTIDEAPDQKGTYTQETIDADKNFIYYLSDDGVYRSNGSEAQLLSENIYEDIRNLANKNTCVLKINKGRIYLWHRSDGSANNDRCYVWNLNFSSASDTVESLDTSAYVSRAFTCFGDSDELLVGSSLVGQLYWQELDSNDYNNLGDDIDFELQTHYMVFTSPTILKQIRKWKPRFKAQSGNYTITGQYAYGLRNNWATLITENVQGSGPIWGSGIVWGAFTWGTTAEIEASVSVPGEYNRIALKYIHSAPRQPHTFLGHTLEVQSRRIR